MPVSAISSIDSRLAEAKALFERNAIGQAESQLREGLARSPAHEGTAMLLAKVLQIQGRFSAASETLLAVCEANGFEPALCLRSAQFAQQCDRHVIAARICERALARDPASAELLMLAGNVAREAGKFEEARAHYLASLASGLDLGRHNVLGALASCRRYTDSADSEIKLFAKHLADTRYPLHSRASAGFALAKAQDNLADYAAAAKALREANGMVHATQAWDGAAWRAFVAARLRERLPAPPASAGGSFVPVFIVGVPRSGTTLTATLLARSTGARDRGELRALRYIADQLVAGGYLGGPSALREAADLYRRLAVQDDAPAALYLDQDPLNFRWLHVAAAMFPQARVVHLRRDRRDTALSLWSQDFAHPDLAFAYNFADMATFIDGHDAMMRHWAQSLSLPIFELDYETLVADTESSLVKLRDFIGAQRSVPGSERDLAPVQSASMWQVRQPIYATSVGRWKHYAPYVPELTWSAGEG